MTSKRIDIWTNDQYHPKPPKFNKRNVIDASDKLHPFTQPAESSVIALAELLIYHLRGDSLDIFLGICADEIRAVLVLPDGCDMLKSPYDVENRIRIALHQLIQRDERNN